MLVGGEIGHCSSYTKVPPITAGSAPRVAIGAPLRPAPCAPRYVDHIQQKAAPSTLEGVGLRRELGVGGHTVVRGWAWPVGCQSSSADQSEAGGVARGLPVTNRSKVVQFCFSGTTPMSSNMVAGLCT